jgi:hypothetical protein
MDYYNIPLLPCATAAVCNKLLQTCGGLCNGGFIGSGIGHSKKKNLAITIMSELSQSLGDDTGAAVATTRSFHIDAGRESVSEVRA